MSAKIPLPDKVTFTGLTDEVTDTDGRGLA